MPGDRLDEIRQRWAAATPGPWAKDLFDREVKITTGNGSALIAEAEHWKDAAAIAAAPEDVAWLVGEVERLRHQRDKLARQCGVDLVELDGEVSDAG